ncbi:hypothetical protein D9619_012648 [Psilocybe cf. subviscida]|uniref:Protein kinase domain-containing protein n=1 Tax=Psilocybe cf. subviscida TaxID=2480587 RepID=A0A8H5B6I3_9AGAR|nr:hypothetical protein D9619_012648 [Psilocybe cf. subviscida]
MFATVTVHNCITGGTKSVHLPVSTSYPAPAYYPKDKGRHVPSSWGRKKPSLSHGNLEVTLLERKSEGRIGVVYRAHVEKATTGEGVDITSSLPATVCLKFAKQHHCRSLAREAWFYEQLHQWQGITIPSYYGFYASTINEQGLRMDDFQPWNDLETPSVTGSEFDEDPELANEYRSMDWLRDDAPYMLDHYSPSKYRNRSRWFKWNFDKENPKIALIILEYLGQSGAEVWPPNKPGDDFKSDILDILDDVGGDGLCHADVTAWNLLQYTGPETDERRCHQHGIVHKWRLIDFDRSSMLDMANTGRNGLYTRGVDKKCVGHPLAFWRRRSGDL